MFMLNLGAALYFVTPLVARKFDVLYDVLIKPMLEWKGGKFYAKGSIFFFFFCLRACKMRAKGCIYHLVRIKEDFQTY